MHSLLNDNSLVGHKPIYRCRRIILGDFSNMHSRTLVKISLDLGSQVLIDRTYVLRHSSESRQNLEKEEVLFPSMVTS